MLYTGTTSSYRNVSGVKDSLLFVKNEDLTPSWYSWYKMHRAREISVERLILRRVLHGRVIMEVPHLVHAVMQLPVGGC